MSSTVLFYPLGGDANTFSILDKLVLPYKPVWVVPEAASELVPRHFIYPFSERRDSQSLPRTIRTYLWPGFTPTSPSGVFMK